ncbi:MAG: relaxase/mobilization nuclease domain-containing protein [Flavisolibacter sp.]|nr:relaxase/mobilization nuclease domain-containing protein [Flavisolibacter sp.]MBD0349527.1 relaxase/mobilization nuclease domain-containing protein [Flavisolibacter sp.]
MVAKVTAPHSVNRALNYNEQKVKQGVAECLCASNFLKDAHELNFYEKLNRFEHQNALHERAKRNTLHISLNFAKEDQLSREKLIEIATQYMEKIGFGEQPYLVYQHRDAGHNHLHIVTTCIRADGSRLNTYNIGKNQSNRARKELEMEYQLVPAESKKLQQKQALTVAQKWTENLSHRAVSAQKVQYGKVETKRAVQNVLDTVINQYKYTSLEELNAVLRQYNVVADRGKEDSRLYQTKGLYYRVLDEKGNRIGAPIKASAFYLKPTLKNLEQKFALNEVLRQPHKQHLKVRIDWAVFAKAHSLATLEKDLQKEGIQMVVRRGEQDVVYGITYIDHRNQCVFNGSDIGKQYSAKGLVERLANRMLEEEEKAQKQSPMQQLFFKEGNNTQAQEVAPHIERSQRLKSALEIVLKPVQQEAYIPHQLLQKKRVKKKPSRGHHL